MYIYTYIRGYKYILKQQKRYKVIIVRLLFSKSYEHKVTSKRLPYKCDTFVIGAESLYCSSPKFTHYFDAWCWFSLFCPFPSVGKNVTYTLCFHYPLTTKTLNVIKITFLFLHSTCSLHSGLVKSFLPMASKMSKISNGDGSFWL